MYSPAELTRWKPASITLFQTCPHLGCRVPSCESSQWFECPCHGSRYNRVGEKRGGPAPRGMDRFPASVDGRRARGRHRRPHPGPAHRHQHHRPGAGGPELPRGFDARMSASRRGRPGLDRLQRRLRHRRPDADRLRRLHLHQHPPGPGRDRLGDWSWRRTGCRTIPTRSSRARCSPATWPSASAPSCSSRSACPLYWLGEPARNEGAQATFDRVAAERGAEHVRRDRGRRPQLRRLPRRHGGHRRRGALHDHRRQR